MTQSAAELVDALRAPLAAAHDVGGDALYEQWLMRETWTLEGEGVALVVGCSPKAWDGYLAAHGLANPAARLVAALAAALHCAPDAAVEPLAIARWAGQVHVELPPAFARLADYLATVLPHAGSVAPEAAQQAAADERERVLGAALALVARFPAQCRDAHGFFDGARIAELILEKGAPWFPHEPPRMSRGAIAALLERYLS